MAVTVNRIVRKFMYGDLELPDPNPNLSAAEVLDLYAPQYPELSTATIEKEEHVGSEIHFKVKRSIGTKG